MEKFIERPNITHYVDLLKMEADPTKRDTLQKLLAEARAKLASPLRTIPKLQERLT